MSEPTRLEPFPNIVSTHHHQQHVHVVSAPITHPHTGGQRLRRKSSGLQGEPRGDATGPAFATGLDAPNGHANPTHRQPSASERPRRSKRRRVKSILKRWKAISLRHTWLNPLIICLTIVAAYYGKPGPSNPLHAALFLSYPLPRQPGADPDAPIQYGKGRRDFAFVAFYTVFLSFTREFAMQLFLRPLAKFAGMKSRGKQSRFMEQGYTALYFAIFGPFGLYVMSRTPVWYFDTQAMYEGFPHRSHDAVFKSYYLLQASYWAQQAIVLLLLLEKPRKDFKELVAHHIITLSLIWLSYRFHFTYMGLAVYTTHDIADFLLASSKILNYMDSIIVVPYFVTFVVAWIYLRHYLNLRILVSMLPLPSPFPDSVTLQINSATTATTDYLYKNGMTLFPKATQAIANFIGKYPQAKIITWVTDPPAEFATIGPYTLDWETQQYKCWIAQWITFGLLAALQSVQIFWLYLILRILWRVIASFGQEHEDDRSEYSEEDQEADAAERKAELDILRKEQLGPAAAEKGDHGATVQDHVQTSSKGKPAVLVNGEPVSPMPSVDATSGTAKS